MTIVGIVPNEHFLEALPAPSADYSWFAWDLRGEPPSGLDPSTVEFAVVNHHVDVSGLQNLPALKVVQVTGVGVEHFSPHIPEGALLCNGAGLNEKFTAELAVTLTLAALRELPYFAELQKRKMWVTESASQPGPRGRTVVGKQVLILGAGSVGTSIGESLSALGSHVTFVARSARTHRGKCVYPMNELPELLPQADIVVSALPLTTLTQKLINSQFLASMRPGALLVNVGRGAVVDTDALVYALHDHRIHAALDVVDPEPLPPSHPLWACPNVLMTPHVGGVVDTLWSSSISFIDLQIARFSDDQPLCNIVAIDKM